MSAAAVHVTIQNTPFEAVTDTGGHFRIENIPAGVYNIIFSKPGFDSMVYPVHHVIGVGTDIINDAYIVQESSDSIELNAPAYVFTVSVSKLVLVIDTTITNVGGKLDTTVLQHDSTVITYDTVQNANALIVSGRLLGDLPPDNLFVYSSLDSTLFPAVPSPQSPGLSEDAWLATKRSDTAYHFAFQTPKLIGGAFNDTLARDVRTLVPYSLPPGEVVYVYVVGHSNTTGLPSTNGEYQHYATTPFGPQAVRFKFVVP